MDSVRNSEDNSHTGVKLEVPCVSESPKCLDVVKGLNAERF